MHKTICKIITFIAATLLAYNASAEMKNFSYKDGKVNYTLTQPDNVTIQLFSQDGEFVTTLFAGEQKKEGEYSFNWSGKDAEGKLVKKGGYILKAGVGRKAAKDAKFAKEGFIQLGNPFDIKADKNGDLYILANAIPEKADGKETGKIIKPAGIYKFKGDGTPINDFYPSETNFLGIPNGRHRWLALDDKNIFCSQGYFVLVMEKTGRIILSVGELTTKDEDYKNRGMDASQGGGAIGADNKIYILQDAGHQIRVFNRTLRDGFLFSTTPAVLPGSMATPSMTSDGKNRLYRAENKMVSRYDDTGTKIVFRYQKNIDGSLIGIALSKDMLYVVDRSPASRIYQLWENGESLLPVFSFGDDAIKGLRAVAVSPDGKSLYLLEDGDDYFGKGFVNGQGRLFKYDLGYAQELQEKVTVAGEPINE